ncbi:MAG: ABC transporter substrate-binding protein [Trichodesmium sp. MO_231.B1]|nr:ABC transporter substrate-binding protein [Trichodesmium sp. MO_231.B1]
MTKKKATVVKEKKQTDISFCWVKLALSQTYRKMISGVFRGVSALVLTTIISCSPSQKTTTPTTETITEGIITATDASNTQITLEKPAERIVCLDILCIDILAELGIKPIGVVGKDMISWIQEPHLFGKLAEKPALIGSTGMLEPNLEQIVQLKPDLVIGINGAHNKTREALKGVVTFYLLSVPQNYSGAIANLKNIAELTDKTAEAETAAKKFLDKLATYKEKSPQNQTVLFIHRPPPNFFVATDKALNCATINEVANCLSAEYSSDAVALINYLPFSLERLVELDPDVIFISSGIVDNYEIFVNYYQDNPLWDNLRAVKNKRVYGASTSRLFGIGTRGLSQMLNQTMPKVYPSVFPDSQLSQSQN